MVTSNVYSVRRINSFVILIGYRLPPTNKIFNISVDIITIALKTVKGNGIYLEPKIRRKVTSTTCTKSAWWMPIASPVRRPEFQQWEHCKISSSCCINAGLIAELNRLSPLVIKKYSQTPPLILNIKTGNQHGTGEVIHKLQAKPPSLTMKLSKRLSRSIWPIPKLPLVPYVLPLIPKTPLLPLFPNWLPRPTGTALDISPSPIAKLSRVLGYSKRNAEIHKKLLEMKHKGSITPAEYFRFQNLLLRI